MPGDLRPYDIAMLHWFTTPLDVQRVGGVVRVELSQLEHLRQLEQCVILYGRQVIGEHSHVNELRKYQLLGPLSARASLVEFMARARNADIWHGANMPALAWLNPKKALIFYSNNADSAPLLGYEQRLEKYKLAHYAFCSRFTRDDFLSRYPDIPVTHCQVIHEAVDVNYFSPPADRPSRHDGIKRLFFLGQWSPEKGIAVLLKAIQILEELRPQRDYRWVIGGSSHYWSVDLAEAQKIETVIAQLTLKKEIVEVVGEVKYSDYPRMLQAMDIFVNPAVWQEPFPLVNMEAMATGLPVVASSVGGIPELVYSEINGLLVPPSDPVALAQAINRLLDAPDRIIQMSILARKTVEDSFTWQSHTTKLLEAYDTVLSRIRYRQ